MTTQDTLRVMPREMRLMTERVLSLTAMPKGFVLMSVDLVMYSEMLGLGGFAMLEQRLDTLKPADPTRLTLADDGLTLNARGEHAWVAVPSLVDLLGLAARRGVEPRITIENALDPEELRIVEAFGRRHGITATLDGTTLSATLSDPADPVLDAVMHDGCRIAADQWWRIYDLAQSALTPDSAVSRRHAGPVIVTEDGKVIGRTDNDDDTDVSFIGSVETKTTREQSA